MESKVNTIFEIVEWEEEKTIHMHTETHTHTDASMYNNIHIDWIFCCRLVYMRTEKNPTKNQKPRKSQRNISTKSYFSFDICHSLIGILTMTRITDISTVCSDAFVFVGECL